jgi:alanyl-tRNA synthetase
MSSPRQRTAPEIRREFLDFFAAREHREVPSAPVFPQDDPTLLFTNAGMNQFKDVFLGTGRRDYARAVDTQKCIRVSGKHNDLEEVGVDTYHHTFFEMLGNWSFGDYFKQEAIGWAWELLTEVWGLPKERLWVTVFGGDEADGLAADEDAERIWREETDVDPSHVLRFDRKDNFWEMGETGPCGPCSEIHIDRGPAGSDPSDGADPEIGVNAGNERFIELWNLVFIQFNRLDDGTLVELPARHVDTGMGFERIVSVLQEKSSNYDTDVFGPIFEAIAEGTGRSYGQDEAVDVAFRVVADHVRAVSVAFADGALPSNVGRGYVLRRLIRRASRYGRQELGVEEPFLFRVVPAVAATLGEAFPEIPKRLEHVQVQVRAEEEAFGKTLGRGLVHFGELARRVEASGAKELPGGEAFELYATYGFPRDLVELMGRERGLEVDADGWHSAEAAHRAASRSEGKFKQLLGPEELDGLEPTESTCHAHDETGEALEARVVLWGEREEEEGDVLVLDRTPFYAESGGQIGDAGTIESEDGTFRFHVRDTRALGNVVVHVGASEGTAAAGLTVNARVDAERRTRTRKNHTATHLMHQALREVLGDHVTQQGSYVGPDRLRFDLSHPKGMTPEELDAIEERVNDAIYANAPVETTVEELEAAKARGVMALFGEKYDERVRVVDVGGWSTELCGGTHVRAAGDIGPFVIVSEGAIQAGVRRIEALTGPEAVQWIQRQRRQLTGAARALKTGPEELATRIEELQKKVKDAKKAAAKSAKVDVEGALQSVREALVEVDGMLVGAVGLGLDQGALRDLAVRVKSLSPDLAVVLVGSAGGQVPWIAVSQGVARESGLDARNVPTFLREHIGGGGGGRPELAQGQGQRADGREALLAALAEDARAAFRA